VNVWILNHYAATPAEQATRDYDLGRELVAKGHTVTIVASSFSHYRFAETRLAPGQAWKSEIHDGVRFVWVRTSSYTKSDWRRAVNMLSYAWRAFRRGLTLPGRPDVVIGTCPHPFAPLAAYVLARLRRARFVYDVRDLWPQTPVEMGALRDGSVVTQALRALERFLFARARLIVTVLPYAGDYVASRGIAREKVVWIPNGVNLTYYQDLAPYRGGAAGNFTVMYVGGHARYQGLDVLLDAARVLQDNGEETMRFVFVGDGPERPRLMARAVELGLRNTEFRGLVPKQQLFRVMEEADAFILKFKDLPLLRYGASPIKLFDYFAAGRPVVYACASRNNAVEESMAGLTAPPEDPAAIAKAVQALSAMPAEERSALGRNGLEYVKKHHDTRALAEKLEAVLAEVVARDGV